MILNEIVPGRVFQADLEAAIDLCVDSVKYRALGPQGNLMINGVICAAFDFRFKYDRSLAAILFPMHDHQPVDIGWFDLAVDFYRRFSPTLVHCHAGRSRSVAIAAALAWYEGVEIETAYARCDSKPERELHDSLVEWTACRRRAG